MSLETCLHNLDTDIILTLGSAGYGRTIRASFVEGETCNCCGFFSNQVLSVDTSEGEYGPVNFCKKCITEIKREMK